MLKKLLIFVMLLGISCGSRMATLVEPTSDETFMVVGAVILQNNQYTSDTEVILDGIDVLITCRYEDAGKEKVKDYWVITDREGYFFLSNVPPGQYALKAIRTTVGIDRLLTIANPLKYSSDEFQIQPRERIPAGSNYFPEQPLGRIVDLKHNFFMVDYASKTNYRVRHQKASKVSLAKLVDGTEVTRPPVPEYFVNKYPQSKWAEHLKKITY